MKKAFLSLVLAVSVLMTFCPIMDTNVYAIGEGNPELDMYLRGSRVKHEFVSMEEYQRILSTCHTSCMLVKNILPTCTKPGYDLYEVCSAGYSKLYIIEIPPIEHDYPDEWKVSKEATHMEAGEEYRACRNKGCQSIQRREIQQIDQNSSSELTTGTDSSCIEREEKSNQSPCDSSKNSEIEKTKSSDNEASGEKECKSNSSCTKDGENSEQSQVDRSNDENSAETKSTSHSFISEWIIEKEPT